ncbi:MAG: hypothetical protein M3Z64_11775 [Verrucomicrobiota bacterium]|nr:hypothetical protein [Verrucomicrobiota bacterium]
MRRDVRAAPRDRSAGSRNHPGAATRPSSGPTELFHGATECWRGTARPLRGATEPFRESGLTPAQVAAQAADADYFSYVLAVQELMANSAKQWTAWKTLARMGGSVPPTGAPIEPTFPAAIPVVAPGIEVRFRALVKQIKANTDYNPSIGAALGIEGSQQLGPDYTTLAPSLTTSISGDRVDVGWGWQGYGQFLDQCELQVDRGDSKGMVLLAIDTTPNYTDTAPFPAAPAKWTYQAIYRVGDQRVGQWSPPVSVTIGG